MDKRIIRTKESIKTAFMQLMLESELSNIGISDIAKRAKVNRSTFYLHYKDVTAVIEDIDSEIADKIRVCIDEFNLDDVYGSIYTMFSYLTSALDRDEIKRKYIIFSSEAGNVVAKLKEILVENTVSAMLETYPTLTREQIFYPLTYAAAGLVDCYAKWVRSGDKKPLDELLKETSTYTEYVINKLTDGLYYNK